MKPMNDKFFIDTNIALYLIDTTTSEKKQTALSLINRIGYISPQVVFECLNVCLKKQKLDRNKAFHFVNYLLKSTYLQEEDNSVVNTALYIFERYNLSVFDSKIVAAALHAGCSTLYSEDMHHGLVIENKLTVINPFL